MSDNTQLNKKRLQWQCRRGMLELELFLKTFLDDGFEQLSAEQKSSFNDLLNIIDPVLFDYLMGTEEPQEERIREIVQIIRDTTRRRVKR